MDVSPTIHASAVIIGTTGILIRGPSGAGKSRLAFALMLAGRSGQIPPTLLVGDDRLHVLREGTELFVRPAENLKGLIEIYGLGIRRCAFAASARLGLVVDLAASGAERLPPPAALSADIQGVHLPRIPVASGHDPLPLVLGALTTSQVEPDATQPRLLDDCQQGFGNHISPIMATNRR